LQPVSEEAVKIKLIERMEDKVLYRKYKAIVA